ncbi:predicted protein [Uncinocarpus reesii 1704]|uniref:DUF8035 domain-containing protein n=1 Tax=Uncinocarpus reesii (strain UAMH 1704) TaxID=336963 RepID=C4JLK0_UNCRE|nr:uncharacterized protein UREG_03708 [Uncinocarpus reesii 1704]EEP78862.1 predicted protein [Uncinocarpus reesii 1704]
MATPKYRLPSPETRTVIDPKASTGNVAYWMEAKVQEIRPKAHQDGTFSTSPHGGQYSSIRPAERHSLDPQSSKTYRFPGQSITPTNARPRSRTTHRGHRPLSLIVPSSTNRSPIIPDYERFQTSRHPGYYFNDDSDRYLSPASSRSRRRTFSPSTRGGQLTPTSKGSSPRTDHAYLVPAGRSRKVYTIDPKMQDMDLNDAYSYTNMREEFLGESARRQHRHDNRGRRPRPVSLTGLEDYPPEAWKDSRYHVPPSGSKEPDKQQRETDHRDHVRSEAPRVTEITPHHTSRRIPVSLHQEKDKRYRDDHNNSRDGRGYRIHRENNDVVVVDDPPYSTSWDSRHNTSAPRPLNDSKGGRDDPESAPVMHGGLATHGYSKERRDRHSDRDNRPYREHRKSRESRRVRDDTGSETDQSESDASLRRHLRRSLRVSNEDSLDEWTTARQKTRKDDSENLQTRSPNPPQKPSPEMRQRKDSEPPAPKGILKTPTAKFPEDPNAIREGVAPLKDATRKGIPPGARWTKIHRGMVNPAALEGYERFEVRPDYVIVLRVLTKEEIQAYANRTAKIRSKAGYHRSRRDRDRDRGDDEDDDDDRRYGRSRHSTDSDDEDEESDHKSPRSPEAARGSRSRSSDSRS